MRCTPSKRWRHVIFNTHNTWLHGDPRGFRDRQHRLHSNGDYKSPPPRVEHADVRTFYASRAGEPVRLPAVFLKPIGEAIVANLVQQQHALAVIAINPTHVHLLVELPDHVATLKKIIGWCKYFATRAARDVDSRLKEVDIWAAGETYKPVDDQGHFRAARNYIATRQGANAWVFNDLSVTDA